LPYFNSWKGPSAEKRHLARDFFDDVAKPPVKSPVPHSAATIRATTQVDIISEHEEIKALQLTSVGVQEKNHNSDDAKELKIDVLEKLNQSIAAKQAQLEQLQASLLSLKSQAAHSDPQVTLDVEMHEVAQTSRPITSSPQISDDYSNKEIGHAVLHEDANPFILVQSKNSSQGRAKPTQTSQLQMPTTSVSAPQASRQPDPLTELAQRRPVYPILPDPVPKRPYFQRTTWRIDIPKDADSPQKALLDAINEIWVVLKEADDKLLVYPWRVRQHGQ
jgi:hypothetical protein